jgi:hypothetical protein
MQFVLDHRHCALFRLHSQFNHPVLLQKLFKVSTFFLILKPGCFLNSKSKNKKKRFLQQRGQLQPCRLSVLLAHMGHHG